MLKVAFYLIVLSTLGGCASHNEYASELDLHLHNAEARNYCKQIKESEQYYQCFNTFMLKDSQVTMHKFLATKRSLARVMNAKAA
ncbi:hypothetical protein [Vibrio hangzhouensis]|uniref:hypothetical protein n=1 Tax=Vibrio hangzhouensis TaxID=462991 RepID=UPI001C97E2D6|nr:hypothetical protein [Vibrio hangzhouensis]MBY6196757.1 hypothetical protein [Vibrio hangzhouensis]